MSVLIIKSSTLWNYKNYFFSFFFFFWNSYVVRYLNGERALKIELLTEIGMTKPKQILTYFGDKTLPESTTSLFQLSKCFLHFIPSLRLNFLSLFFYSFLAASIQKYSQHHITLSASQVGNARADKKSLQIILQHSGMHNGRQFVHVIRIHG